MAYRGRYRSVPLHITLPGDLHAALESRRHSEGLNRSEAIAEALRLWMSVKDSEELDRRERISERFEDVLEMVKRQADRLATLEVRNRYAIEMVYELLNEVTRSGNSREEMRRRAAGAIDRERPRRREN
jgi:hypothetical protein